MNRLSLIMTVTVLWVGITMTEASGQTSAAPSVLAGAYTEEQAVSGQVLYYQHCINCHGENMAGVDQAPPLAGPQFSSNWNGESLWTLVERMGTMPPDKPGILSRQEIVDTLTYVLWFNGLPLGNVPLDTEKDVLAGINFQSPPPGQ